MDVEEAVVEEEVVVVNKDPPDVTHVTLLDTSPGSVQGQPGEEDNLSSNTFKGSKVSAPGEEATPMLPTNKEDRVGAVNLGTIASLGTARPT